jgi:hypothetical protein
MNRRKYATAVSCYVCGVQFAYFTLADALLGLLCYMTTKILIYYFLVEKAVSSRTL